MDAGVPDAGATLIRRLEKLAKLTSVDRDAIQGLAFTSKAVRSNDQLVRDGAMVTECCLLLDGYACRYKVSADGKRQIVSFHMPGDMLDLQHLLLARADHSVQTITHAKVAWVSAKSLKQLAQSYPAINEAFWRENLIDASIFREWVLNVGRRPAKARVAHMLSEFATRREAAGLGAPDLIELPMTQEQIADATGLTTVHVNRMLAELERDGAVTRGGRALRIRNWQLFRQIGDFDPAYLHLAA